MREERWEQVKDLIKKKFKVILETKTKEEEKEIERIEFEGPLGKMKLEWVTKPKVLEIKTSHATKRPGGAAPKIEKVLSKTEKVRYLKVYLWKNNDWQEISLEKMEF